MRGVLPHPGVARAQRKLHWMRRTTAHTFVLSNVPPFPSETTSLYSSLVRRSRPESLNAPPSRPHARLGHLSQITSDFVAESCVLLSAEPSAHSNALLCPRPRASSLSALFSPIEIRRITQKTWATDRNKLFGKWGSPHSRPEPTAPLVPSRPRRAFELRRRGRSSAPFDAPSHAASIAARRAPNGRRVVEKRSIARERVQRCVRGSAGKARAVHARRKREETKGGKGTGGRAPCADSLDPRCCGASIGEIAVKIRLWRKETHAETAAPNWATIIGRRS